MDYTVLLIFVILSTVQTTSHHHGCNSDAYSPASGMDDFHSHDTTLQYCIIDNCTIMRIDTGQQLNIVYTTQSLLVVTPTDGKTSMIISKNEPELSCLIPNTADNFIIQIVGIILLPILALISGYIAAVHMIFKELRSTFGKLMMYYNIAVIIQCANTFALNITRHNIAVHSTFLCYLFNSMFMQSAVVGETFSTCALAYLAYIMHHSYKSRQLTDQLNKKLYKYSIIYVLGNLLLFDIFILGYDFGTGTYKHTILPNGHCSFFVQSEYDTIRVFHVLNNINRALKGLLIVTYFTYHYKVSKTLRMVHSLAMGTDTQQNQLFLKIAITMGATLGISQIFFTASWFFDNEIALRIGGFFFIIQQCVIMSFYMCTKKMSRLCKDKFCTTEKSP